MELRDLQIFIGVAEANGFRRAAQHLGVEQSALSRRIRTLEDKLGVSLFERHRGGVRLTFAGERFLGDVRRIIADLDRAVASVAASGLASEGVLTIGLASSFTSGFLRDLLCKWRGVHPLVEVHICEGSPRSNVGRVLSRELDVAFATGASFPPGCDHETLWTDRIYAAVPLGTSYPLELDMRLTDVADARFLVTKSGFGPEIRDFVIKRLADLGFSPTVDIVDVERSTLMSMVGLGMGITLVSGQDIGAQYPGVRYIPVANESIGFNAVWSPDNDNPALRRFLSLARVQAKRARGGLLQTPDP